MKSLLIIKKTKIISDFGLNIFASSITIIALQFIVYPLLAKSLGDSDYGKLLTIMGIVNIVTSSFGITLNNTRLIQNSEYIENNQTGDFNIILIVASSISFIAIIIFGAFVFDCGIVSILLIPFCTVLGVFNAYMNVEYRLKLNYKRLTLCNIITFLGYMVGTFFAYDTKIWIVVFIFGELANCIFLVLTTDILKESFKITKLFKNTLNKYFLLIITGLLANVAVYLDRLIIYPVLGSEAVSAYTVASFFGKALGLVMTPVSGVLLSYFAQKDFKMDLKKFWGINISFVLAAFTFFIFSYFVSVWFTGLLYPTLVSSAEPYILLANIAAIIGVVANMATPVVLRYSNTIWQLIIQVAYLVVYFGASAVLLASGGLMGFCIAAILANSIKVLLLYFVGTITLTNKYLTKK